MTGRILEVTMGALSPFSWWLSRKGQVYNNSSASLHRHISNQPPFPARPPWQKCLSLDGVTAT